MQPYVNSFTSVLLLLCIHNWKSFKLQTPPSQPIFQGCLPKNNSTSEPERLDLDFWSKVEASDEGMLDAPIIEGIIDVEHSNYILDKLLAEYPPFPRGRALDIAAGVGRVTKNMLLGRLGFRTVDMQDLVPRLLNASEQYLGSKLNPKVGNRFGCPLQHFFPPEDVYDLVWIQWVFVYLNDQEMVQSLRRVRKSMKRDSYLIIKEVVVEESEYDDIDGSFFRPLKLQRDLMSSAGFKLVMEDVQDWTDRGYLPDAMWVFTALEEQ